MVERKRYPKELKDQVIREVQDIMSPLVKTRNRIS